MSGKWLNASPGSSLSMLKTLIGMQTGGLMITISGAGTPNSESGSSLSMLKTLIGMQETDWHPHESLPMV